MVVFFNRRDFDLSRSASSRSTTPATSDESVVSSSPTVFGSFSLWRMPSLSSSVGRRLLDEAMCACARVSDGKWCRYKKCTRMYASVARVALVSCFPVLEWSLTCQRPDLDS